MNNSYGHIKWISNHRYFIYLVRELTAVPLAIFGIYLLMDFTEKSALLKLPFSIPEQYIIPIHYIGLTGAIIHSLTWFFALPKILPFTSNPIREKIAGIIVLTIWILFTYTIFQYLYK